MGPQYPELVADAGRIRTVADAEEASFLATLRTGTALFDLAAAQTKKTGSAVLAGSEAFQLHDTFGFPIDLTLEMAAEAGLGVDEAGFRALMKEQRDRAKADSKAKKSGMVDLTVYRAMSDAAGAIDFTGYTEVASEGAIRGLLIDGVEAGGAAQGQQVEVVLDRTPFYAEGGGQLADRGVLRLASGAVVEVLDVQKPVPGLIVHRGRVVSGEVAVGESALGEVDLERRRGISRAHTATHMVHKAFREALGETASQAGSENAPGRFRFDFASPGAVPASVLADVEARVNALLTEDLAVTAEVMSQEQALAMGAMALFGEKYGDEVRVVSVGDWARELCGGTHVARSGQLGLVKLLGESSIGAGVRRVEALVGVDAYRFLAREHVLVSQLAEALKARPEELPERVAGIVERLRVAEKDLERFRAGRLLEAAPALVAAAAEAGPVWLVAHDAGEAAADDLRRLALDVRGRLAERPAVVAVAGVSEGRPVIVVAVNDAGRAAGAKAGALVRVAAQALGGGGGGKDDVAQGGGTDAAAVGEALRRVSEALAGLA